MSVRRRSVRKNLHDNSNIKRWSQPPAETNEQEEQISSKSSYLTLLTTKLGIPKEKAYVENLRFLRFLRHNHRFSERACVATGFRSLQAATDW